MVSASNVSADIASTFSELTKNKVRYLIAKISDDNDQDIVLDKQGPADASWDDFKADVPEDQPRFIVYNLAWTDADARNISKIIFINYVPDACTKMALKFKYANLKEGMKSSLNPLNKEFQINDHLDLKFDDFKNEF